MDTLIIHIDSNPLHLLMTIRNELYTFEVMP